jgi:ABC-type transport system involved in multi-copper enzyme maturation permease subunit
MSSYIGSFVAALLLLSVYVLAAAPWAMLAFVGRERLVNQITVILQKVRGVKNLVRAVQGLLVFAGGVLVVVIGIPILTVFALFVGDRATAEMYGMWYGAGLQIQLIVDFFIVAFIVLLRVWPKGAAVGLAAFREGVRQPLFWVLFLFGFAALIISPFIPYFTFGEDLVMVKDLGYDFLLAVSALFGALAASQSISEEIEGRTAITLMSKPVSRRQFLLGKFLGIVLASLLLFGVLSWIFEGTLQLKLWLDRADPVPPPGWVAAAANAPKLDVGATHFLIGVGLWTNHTLDTLPGLVMTFSAVMVLVAVATALATRATVVVNLATVFAIYFLANLAPVLVFIGRKLQKTNGPNDPVAQLVSFTAGVFDTVLPDLDAFRIGPALALEAAVPMAYVGSVLFYGVLYTLILVLFGLILFEDRDLA